MSFPTPQVDGCRSKRSAIDVQDSPSIAVPAFLAEGAAHPSALSVVKRAVDVVGALVGLAITAAILIPVYLAIQIDDPGPVFYRQLRCGLKGRQFYIWKFRSMVQGAENVQHLVQNEAQGLVFKNQADPRVTRIGKFLRETSLDELPQFWNVLKGEMSLVGTRPPTVDEVQRYEAHHWERLNVKPGITGEWQVKGRSNVKDFEVIVRLDLAYQQHWSVSHDLQLILQTIIAVLKRQGAF
ncbi:UDP-phosphate galactose phosphotransferase [filamentous cyanobacterium CCP5]|nr:UDP-phosphate galactose phosphotransferase [filamentous cyanobacterium CCP5]